MNPAPTRKDKLARLRAVRDAAVDQSRDNRAELHSLLQERGLTRQQAADKLGVSVHTINSWLKPKTSKSHHRCPSWAVELLKMETRS